MSDDPFAGDWEELSPWARSILIERWVEQQEADVHECAVCGIITHNRYSIPLGGSAWERDGIEACTPECADAFFATGLSGVARRLKLRDLASELVLAEEEDNQVAAASKEKGSDG